MINLAVDCYSDKLILNEILRGCYNFVRDREDVNLYLIGNKIRIKKDLRLFWTFPPSNVIPIDSPEFITENENPLEAVEKKPNSSIVIASKLLGNKEVDGIVTMGSSGATLISLIQNVGKLEGVRKPAMCPAVLSTDLKPFIICDSGATTSITADQLKQYALLATPFMQIVYGIKNPTVSLLNIGIEEGKGDLLRKEAYSLLKNTKGISFIGNIESRDLLLHNADIVITDGFTGNILCKTLEGCYMHIPSWFRDEILKKIPSLFKTWASFFLDNVMKIADFHNYPGAAIFGIDGIAVKLHGEGNYHTIEKSLELAYKMHKGNLLNKQRKLLAS